MLSNSIFRVPFTIFLSLFAMAILGMPAGHAATFTVTTLADDPVSPPAGSLRQAINDANADMEPDTIVFAGGLSGTLILVDDELEIESPMTIEGPGADVLGIVTNTGTFRIFEIFLDDFEAQVTIRGLKLSNGGGEGLEADGGAIAMLQTGMLTVDSCVLSNNTVKNGGATAGGGAIFLAESTTGRILNSVIKNNRGEGGGGGILTKEFAILEIRDSEISGNTTESMTSPGDFFEGGGIAFGFGELNILNSVIKGNHADEGGGVSIEADFETSINIANSQFFDNTAEEAGGGLVLFGNDPSENFFNIRNSQFSGNRAGYYGGALAIGGVHGEVSNSTLDNNFSGMAGDPEGGFGGGMALEEADLVMMNSTISGNVANRAGGGIAFEEEVNLDLISVTIFGNTADADGIDPMDGIPEGGGGLGIIEFEGFINTRMKNSILAGNTDANGAPDCSWTIFSDGFNLLGNDEGCTFIEGTGDLVGTAGSPIDPLLDPNLQANGGTTPTHALLAGSPAIDAAGGNVGCGVETDQRGVLRPQGPRCDMGAYEKEVAQPDDSGAGQEAEDGGGCQLNPSASAKHLAWAYLLCLGVLLAMFVQRRKAKAYFRRRK